MSVVSLDTSVVIRLLIGEPEEQARLARSFLDERLRTGQPPAWLSALVISEAFFALRHHYQVPTHEVLVALRNLIGDRRVQTTTDAELSKVNDLVDEWCQRLTDISWFVRVLNESIARQANRAEGQ